jgi:hypothetical protein
MCRVLFVATTLIAFSAGAGYAQNPHGVTLADVAGLWDYRATVGSAGGVVVASVLTATGDRNGWTIQHEHDPPVPVRVGAVAGDSIIADAGPYASTLRPGQTVVQLHIVLHYHDGRLTGPFEARYASGEVVRGTVDVTRRN